MDPEVERLMMMQQARGGQQRPDATTPDKCDSRQFYLVFSDFTLAEKWSTSHLWLCSKLAQPAVLWEMY